MGQKWNRKRVRNIIVISEPLNQNVKYIDNFSEFDLDSLNWKLVNKDGTEGINSGILLVQNAIHTDTQWGTVCDSWLDTHVADVICRKLGFDKAFSVKPIPFKHQ